MNQITLIENSTIFLSKMIETSHIDSHFAKLETELWAAIAIITVDLIDVY